MGFLRAPGTGPRRTSRRRGTTQGQDSGTPIDAVCVHGAHRPGRNRFDFRRIRVKGTFAFRVLGSACLALTVQAGAQETALARERRRRTGQRAQVSGRGQPENPRFAVRCGELRPLFLWGGPGRGKPRRRRCQSLSRFALASRRLGLRPASQEERSPTIRGCKAWGCRPHRSGGVGVAYTQDWFTLRTSVLSDILNRATARSRASTPSDVYRPGERLTLFAGPGLTWADHRYTQTISSRRRQSKARPRDCRKSTRTRPEQRPFRARCWLPVRSPLGRGPVRFDLEAAGRRGFEPHHRGQVAVLCRRRRDVSLRQHSRPRGFRRVHVRRSVNREDT